MANKGRVAELANGILLLVGGRENISYFTHCVTRLRFTVKDKSLIDKKEIEILKGVIGTNWSGDQFQVIIGQEVDKVYEIICSVSGISAEKSIDENLDPETAEDGKKFSIKKIGNNIVSYLSSTMFTIVPILIGASLCKTVNSLFGPGVLNLYSDTSDLYIMFEFLYNALFYFLPIFVGYTAAKTLKTNVLMGMFLGAMIIVPNFMALVGVRDTFSIFGVSVPVANYSQTFFPVVLGVWVMSYVHKFLKKVIPDVVSSIFVPFLTILVMTFMMFVVCAPLGSAVGEYIGAFFTYMGSSNPILRIIGSTLLAAIMPFITLMGMHLPVYMPAITNLLTTGSESFVMPIGQVYSYAVYGMALGAVIKFRKKENKSLATGYFVSGIIGGVSEPTLYGICLNNKSGMMILAACCGIGGLISGILSPGVCNMAPANIFSTIAVWAPLGTSNIIRGLILQIASFVIGVLGVVLFDKLKEE